MSDPRKHIVFSCIGPPMKGDTDPIYQVALRFPPVAIHLVTSDEPPPESRETTEVNITQIRDHFKRATIPVTDLHLNLTSFESNSFLLAGILINSYKDHPDMQLLVDLSAGRGSIRQALSRAAEIAIDVIHSQYDPDYFIIVAIRSRNQPVLHYKVGRTSIPKGKDVNLLLHIEMELTQTALARKIEWNNQSEVSKGVQRLEKLGLVVNKGHKTRELTDTGKRIKELFVKIK